VDTHLFTLSLAGAVALFVAMFIYAPEAAERDDKQP